MKRVLLITTLIAVLAVAVAVPYWFGVEAQRIYIDQMNALHAGNKIDIVDNSFQRGWFSSDAQTRLSIEGVEATFLARHTMEHGPIPASDPISYITSLHPLQALIRSQLFMRTTQSGEDSPLGSMLTTVNMDGTTHTRIQFPAAAVRPDQSSELSWREVSGQIDFSPADKSWHGFITSDGADWRRGDAGVEVGPLKLTFVSIPGSTGLAMGNSSLETESLEAQLPGPVGRLSAREVTIRSSASEQAERVSYSMSGSLASAAIDQLKIDSGNWNLEIKDLDRGALTRLSGMDVGAAIPLNDLIESITKRDAKLDSFVKFSTSSGPMVANASIGLSGGNGSTNPLMILGTLQGRFDMDMPAAVVELAARSALKSDLAQMETANEVAPLTAQQQEEVLNSAVPGKIQSWVDRNLLTRRGDSYRFEASIDRGALQLNNRPFDFMSLLR